MSVWLWTGSTSGDTNLAANFSFQSGTNTGIPVAGDTITDTGATAGPSSNTGAPA